MITETQISRKISRKQSQALAILTDKETNELLYGGGGGGGKSVLLSYFGIDMSLGYQGIRGAICRKELKKLKETTLLTLFDCFQRDGLKDGRDFIYDKNASIITFPQTGSIIFLLELDYYPSDPNWDRLGSYELTWAAIDEAQQVDKKAKDTLSTRIRYKVSENGLVPKMLLNCNPSKGYLYSEFYKPDRDGELPASRKFLKSLVTDNPFIDKTYIENLKRQPLEIKERLLYGNWEYDDDPTRLMGIDEITDIFTNALKPSKDKYIIADIARFGSDYTVVAYFEGLDCKRIAAYKKLPIVSPPHDPKMKSSASVVDEWRIQYQVPLSHVLVDEDGIGGGVKDALGCRGFVANRPAFRKNYASLKNDCYFLLADKVNAHEIAVRTFNEKLKKLLIEDLEQVKEMDADKDTKRRVIPKDKVKERTGRSPDFSDTLMMRMYFELLPRPKITLVRT